MAHYERVAERAQEVLAGRSVLNVNSTERQLDRGRYAELFVGS